MAKKARGCCLGFLMGIVFTFVLIVGGLFFSSNYFIKKYLGDDGEFMALGIKNVFQLIDFINAVGKEPDMSGVIYSESVPSEASKAEAVEKLKGFGFPIKEETGELDVEKLLSGGIKLPESGGWSEEITMTGAELASVINMALDAGAQGSANLYGMRTEQIHLDNVSESGKECDITLTLSLPLDATRDKLGPAAALLSAGKIYLTCVNTMTVTGEGGKDVVGVAPKGEGGIRINNLKEKQSNQVFSAFLAMSGAGPDVTPKAYSEELGQMLAGALNNIEGKKSFVAGAGGKPAAFKFVRI